MTDTGLAPFLPTAFAGPGWDLVSEQLERPRASAPSLEEIGEELAVRDFLARYAYTFDRGDLEGVLRFFTDDCVINSPRGTVSGSQEIRANYEGLVRGHRHRFHLLTNIVVRLSAGLRDGLVTAYHYAVLEPHDEPPRAVGGLIADHVVKRDGEWKIAARTATIDLAHGLAAAP